jgi:hypothetical protein
MVKKTRIGFGIVLCLILLWAGLHLISRLVPINLTKDFKFSRGLTMTRESSDHAGDDAGYFTIFRSMEPVDLVRDKVRKELASSPGWSEALVKDVTLFRRNTDDGEFIIRVLPSSKSGTVISVTQRVDSDRMFHFGIFEPVRRLLHPQSPE